MKIRLHSLAFLIIIVGLTALYFAAIRASSPGWAAITTLIGLIALLSSIPGIFILRGRSQAFWIGFATLGGGFFGLKEFSEYSPNDCLWRNSVGGFLGDAMFLMHPSPFGDRGYDPSNEAESSKMDEVKESRVNCMRILDWLTVMSLGLIGGGIGRIFAVLRERQRTSLATGIGSSS